MFVLRLTLMLLLDGVELEARMLNVNENKVARTFQLILGVFVVVCMQLLRSILLFRWVLNFWM